MAEDDFIRAGSAILNDLALFNQATTFLEENIDPVIRTAVGDTVKEWMERKNWQGDWDGSDTFTDIALWPSAWKEGEDLPFARFRFDYHDEDATNSFEIADLFGSGQTEFGFRFLPQHSWFGGKLAWNAFAKTITKQIDPLAKAGWLHEGKGVFFRPVTLTAEHVTSAWENKDWSEALKPLTAALDGLESDQALFDSVLYKANPKQG